MNARLNCIDSDCTSFNEFSSVISECNKIDAFSTPVKKTKRICIEDTQELSNFVVDCQESYSKNSNKPSIGDAKYDDKFENSESSGLSPFSKFCANLSPLYKSSGIEPKRFREPNFNKFSVEFMKSPVVGGIVERSITEERLDFNFDCDFDDHNTPTFKSVPDDTIVKQLLFIKEDKENIDVNRKIERSQNSICSQKSSKDQAESIDKCSDNCSHVHEVEEKEKIYDRSRGSTSPESNSQFLKERPEFRKRQDTSDFEFSDGNQSLPLFHVKKREVKKRNKKSQPNGDNEAESGKKQERGCTCKKSQCKKLYCECFLSQKQCTSACSCFSCCNTEENHEMILEIRNSILSKNPNAFIKLI